MTTGIIFDIKEFAIHDGPGIRTTVFLKGCPLRCTWCHNPEGLSSHPQIMKTPVSERFLGKVYSSQDLAGRLNKYADILKLNQGGITFSGGEPLLQARFVSEVIDQLEDIHVLLDTSGYGGWDDLLLLVSRCNLVYFDLKILDPVLFREYTGGNIQVVLQNLQTLSNSGVPFIVRTPLIPRVTDTEENLSSIVGLIRGLHGLLGWELLPYNRLAGAKYEFLGMRFQPGFDETVEPNISTTLFSNLKVPWKIV